MYMKYRCRLEYAAIVGRLMDLPLSAIYRRGKKNSGKCKINVLHYEAGQLLRAALYIRPLSDNIVLQSLLDAALLALSIYPRYDIFSLLGFFNLSTTSLYDVIYSPTTPSALLRINLIANRGTARFT